MIPEEWNERYLARNETWEDEASQVRQRHIEDCRSKLAALKGKLDRINTAFADGGLDLQELRK